MKISVPYFVLPIPDKKLDFMNPLALTVTITNNTSNTIRAAYDTLIPELIDPNGQRMQLQRIKEPSLDTRNFCSLVEPGAAILFSGAVLAWKNNKLQLYGEAGNGYKWYFDGIKPGRYQLRFTYYSPGGEISCYDLETDTFRRVEGVGSGRGATSFIPIRIVQPISKDPIKNEGKITVKQVKLIDPPAQSSDFMKILKNLFQGWEFNTAQISGRFEVVENNPYYIPDPNFPDEAIQVGAKFQLNYLYQIAEDGAYSSFHNNLNNLHWIQRADGVTTPSKGLPIAL